MKKGPPHEVRIIGGQWKRSKLPVADQPGLRPTPDRVRETLFNWLGQDLSGWRCLDAFAGSGALGFEAASRGAAEVVLLERDAELAASLQATKQRLKADALRVEARRCHRLDGARRRPAASTWCSSTRPSTAGSWHRRCRWPRGCCLRDGLIYLESRLALPAPPEGWALHRQGRAGAVHFHLLRRASDGYTPGQSGPSVPRSNEP